jgi:trimethylamine--corrinoid protein Co-methyltransferase
MTNSLESIVMADELINWVKRFMQGVEISDETLALDVTHRAGPANTFMQDDHTRAHYREDWYPKLVERRNFDAWSAAGGQSFRQRAQARALKLLATHRPEPLPADMAAALQGVVDRAAARYL